MEEQLWLQEPAPTTVVPFKLASPFTWGALAAPGSKIAFPHSGPEGSSLHRTCCSRVVCIPYPVQRLGRGQDLSLEDDWRRRWKGRDGLGPWESVHRERRLFWAARPRRSTGCSGLAVQDVLTVGAMLGATRATHELSAAPISDALASWVGRRCWARCWAPWLAPLSGWASRSSPQTPAAKPTKRSQPGARSEQRVGSQVRSQIRESGCCSARFSISPSHLPSPMSRVPSTPLPFFPGFRRPSAATYDPCQPRPSALGACEIPDVMC